MAIKYVNNAGIGAKDGSESAPWSWDTQYSTILAGISDGDELVFLQDTYAVKSAQFVLPAGVTYRTEDSSYSVVLESDNVANEETIQFGAAGVNPTLFQRVGFRHLTGVRAFVRSVTADQDYSFEDCLIDVTTSNNASFVFNHTVGFTSNVTLTRCYGRMNCTSGSQGLCTTASTITLSRCSFEFTNVSGSTDVMNDSVVSPSSFSYTSGTGNTVTDSPLFTDPSNGDFTLLPNSPAITAGGASIPDLTGYTNIYWVDPTGGGTPSVAGQTTDPTGPYWDFSAALTAATANDAIVFKDGSYTIGTIAAKDGVDFIGESWDAKVTLTSTFGITFTNVDCNIKNLDITYTGGADFFATYTADSAVEVSRCKITQDGTRYLVSTTVGSSVNFNGCEIYDNSTDGGVYTVDSTFSNCTYIKSTSGAVFTSSGTPTRSIISSVFSGSGGSLGPVGTSIDSLSIVDGFSSLNQGGNPLFVDSSNNNFTLLPNSPAITAGGETVTGDFYLDFNATIDGGNDGSQGNPWARFSEVGQSPHKAMADGQVVIVTSSSNGVSTGSGDAEHRLNHTYDLTYKAESGKVELLKGGILNLAATGGAGKKITFDGVSVDGTGTVGRLFDFQNNGTQREAKLEFRNARWTVQCNSSVEWFCSMSTSYSALNELTMVGAEVVMKGVFGSGNNVTSSVQNVTAIGSLVRYAGEGAGGALTAFATATNGVFANFIFSGEDSQASSLTSGLSVATNTDCYAAGIVDTPTGVTILSNLLFIDAPNGNLELLPNSPAISAGA